MGVTGQVGGAIADRLLEEGKKVRAFVRNAGKAAVWADRGCELAAGDANDADALTQAFKDAEGVFVMLPPDFDPSPEFPEARQAVGALHKALSAAKPGRVVALSTIGGHLERPSLLSQLHMLETVLGTLPLPIAFLRPAWFIENISWDIPAARESGVVPSFLQPLERVFPMIGTRDIGKVAAELLLEQWQGRRVVELEGPGRISPNEIANAISDLLARDVRMEAVPRETWERHFESQGMKNPTPRMQMLDGFNEGWLEFEGGESGSRKTQTTLREVLPGLVGRVQ